MSYSYSSRSRFSTDSGRGIAYVILFGFIIIFSIWFYSADASGQGSVADKWVETNTSCDSDGDCTTSHDYMVQFTDSRVYRVFWGRMHWDGMMRDAYIAFEARGRMIYLGPIRIKVPDIFSYEVLEAPR